MHKTSIGNVIEWIMLQVQISGSTTHKSSHINMLDFFFIKEFKVNILPPKEPTTK